MAMYNGAPPNASGGNDPVVVAGLMNKRRGTLSAVGADANQVQRPEGQASPAGQEPFGARLAGILDEYIRAGAPPEMTEQIRQFFEAFVKIAEETQAGISRQAQAPGAGPQGFAGETAQSMPMPARAAR